MIKSVLIRFLKGGLAGAATSMALVKLFAPSTWTDVYSLLNLLAIAGAGGFISGFILAVEKWAGWKE